MIIYQITNTLNGKRYIGMTEQANPGRRWSAHKWGAKKRWRMPITSAIAEHGAENFVFEPIASLMPGLGREALGDLERLIIAQEGTICPTGYNLSPGGDGVPVGTPNPSKGKTISDEHRAKLRAAWARNPDRHDRQRALNAQRGQSPESRAKISAGHSTPERVAALQARNVVMNQDPAHWAKIKAGWAKSPHRNLQGSV